MQNQQIRIRLKAFDHRLIDQSTQEIVEATDVRSMSQGRASYSMEFKKYNTAPAHIAETVSKKQG